MKDISYTFSVAPMMDWTDRHERYFLRLITTRTRLYTEMVTAQAIIHGHRDALLSYNEEEHPIALQIGGSDPAALSEAAKIGADYGYDEINLNVGCPSDRVRSGRFGACLMAEPQLVGECVAAIKKAVDVPVTVKCRIGIDEQDIDKDLDLFTQTYRDAGGDLLIVHARKAWLRGLSPKDNRTIPPLNYPRVYQLKKDFPDMKIIINGGIESLDEATTHLNHVDGVMMGRAAYQTPYILSQVDQKIFSEDTISKTRQQIMDEFMPYAEAQLLNGVPLHAMTRHILGLYHGEPGARLFRRHLSENACKNGAGIKVLHEALAQLTYHSERAEDVA